jgi:hypothetical protein
MNLKKMTKKKKSDPKRYNTKGYHTMLNRRLCLNCIRKENPIHLEGSLAVQEWNRGNVRCHLVKTPIKRSGSMGEVEDWYLRAFIDEPPEDCPYIVEHSVFGPEDYMKEKKT